MLLTLYGKYCSPIDRNFATFLNPPLVIVIELQQWNLNIFELYNEREKIVRVEKYLCCRRAFQNIDEGSRIIGFIDSKI